MHCFSFLQFRFWPFSFQSSKRVLPHLFESETNEAFLWSWLQVVVSGAFLQLDHDLMTFRKRWQAGVCSRLKEVLIFIYSVHIYRSAAACLDLVNCRICILLFNVLGAFRFWRTTQSMFLFNLQSKHHGECSWQGSDRCNNSTIRGLEIRMPADEDGGHGEVRECAGLWRRISIVQVWASPRRTACTTRHTSSSKA